MDLGRLSGRLGQYMQDRVAQAGQMTQGPFHAPGGIDQAAGGATGLIGTMTMPEDVAGPLGRGLSRLLNADPAAMTPSEINKTIEALQAENLALAKEFIAAGRGSVRPSELRSMSDPLAERANRIADAIGRLQYEVRTRMGPGEYKMVIGKGFGPRRRVP